jgi:hypothetical protein
MQQWISDLLVFGAGVSGGILVMMIKPYFSLGKKKRTELVAARSRILAVMKEKHEEEILDEAFRTTEAIRSELDRSLETLRKTLNAVTEPEGDQRNGQQIIHLSDTIKPNPSRS